MKTETLKSFKIAVGSVSSDGDAFSPNCKFTLKEGMIKGEKQIIPTPEQVKHGLHFEILKSHQGNGATCIDEVKLISG